MQQFFIEYFRDIESFIDLQVEFTKEDFIYLNNPEISHLVKRKFISEDFYIQDQVPLSHKEDPTGLSYGFEKRYFYKDHLPYVIKRISFDYLEGFYDHIREELLEDQKKRRKFLDEEKKHIASIFENINQFNFLESSVFNELKAQIIEIEKAIHSPTLYNDKFLKADKLTLKGWNETDLVTFFNFLRNQNVIDFISDAELGRFLERNFCVEREDSEISFLDSLNKRLNDIKNTNKLNDRSEKRLYNLFQKINRF